MKIKSEIIRQPAGTYSVWIDGKEESSGWRKLEYAEMHIEMKKKKNMKNETYNGWSNYSTWRVNLELFDGDIEQWSESSPEAMQEFAELLIEESTDEGIGRDYAMAFLSDVNWQEIAEHYNEE